MKKKYGSILLLIFIFLLAACNNESENESNTAEIEDVKKSENNENETTENENTEAELMSEDEIKATVEENLDKMEEIVQADFDQSLMPIDETTFAPDTGSEQAEALVNQTKKDFKNLVAEETLDEWVRHYLYSSYISYHKEYLNSDEIHTRFEVMNQSADHFEISFITLEDNGSLANIAGTHLLYYIKENDNWVFEKRIYFSPEEKPLHLTFEDIEEHHNKLIDGDFEFEAIQETDIDGINHLVYRIGNEYYARNEHNSTFNYEVIE